MGIDLVVGGDRSGEGVPLHPDNSRITYATGLIEDGDGESLAVLVQDTPATLNSLEIVLQDRGMPSGAVRHGRRPRPRDYDHIGARHQVGVPERDRLR